MNCFKRLPLALLAAAMVLTLLSGGGVTAANAAEPVTFQETDIHINPEYRDILSEADLQPPLLAADSGVAAAIGEEDYTQSTETVGTLLREAMRNREASVILHYAVGEKPNFTTLMTEIRSIAYRHTGVPDEGDYLYRHYAGSTATANITLLSDVYYYDITVDLKYYTTAAQEAQVTARINSLLKELDVDSGTDYEKVRAIYDYICDTVVYDYDRLEDDSYTLKYTTYAALMDNVAVCQGYATLFYRLALELGVDARYISGTAKNINHGWNIVALNGLYYNLDSTWDTGKGLYEYFLLCPDNFTDHIRKEDYETEEFHAAYPMSSTDFDVKKEECSHMYTETDNTATCTEAGIKTYVCIKCEKVKTGASDPLGHSYFATITKPTCTEEGYTTYTCSRCGLSSVGDKTAAKGHSGGSATCSQQAVCEICGAAYGELTKHIYSDAWSCDASGHWRSCTSCGANTSTEVHVPNAEAATEDTARYCTFCGYVLEPVHTHTVTQVAAEAATCTQAGHTAYYTCACGKWFQDTAAKQEITDKASVEVPALGHSAERQGQVEATETAPGYTGDLVCTRCGETVETGQEIPATGTTQSSIRRVSGSVRYETAIQVAETLKEVLDVETFDNILLACGGFGGANDTGFADALGGSYLAAVKNAPILLYSGDKSVEVNLDYIQNNLAEGGTVYILGGSAAVPEAVETVLQEAGLTVIRLKGDTRFETNLAILEEAQVGGKEILVVSGWGYADSLSTSATGLPVLMLNTNSNALTDAQKAFLEANKDSRFTIVGGVSAVSESLEAAISEIVSTEVRRVAGATRESTSVEVAKAYFDAPEYAVVAYSRGFPDGLSGGPLAYALKAPLLLTTVGYEATTHAYIEETGVETGYLIGGTAVVSEETARAVFGIS